MALIAEWSQHVDNRHSTGEKIFEDCELIGAAEAGFNPYSFRLINGPLSQANNNLKTIANQQTMFDSARAGQWDNGQGFVGISNPTFGAFTFGRTVLLSQSALGAYDPVASVAFSQIGTDIGKFSFDAIGNYAQNALSLCRNFMA